MAARKNFHWRAALAVLVAGFVVVGIARAAPDSYGPVGANETLWTIGKKLAAGRGTTAQTAWALYRANPEAFEGSAGRLRSGAMLRIPDAAFVRQVPAADAYAALTGKAVTAPKGATPVPAAAAPPPIAAASEPAAPQIASVELEARESDYPYQWLALNGTGFAPGAMLELRDLSQKEGLLPRRPQSVRANRIEYAARFPERMSRWQVVVRNPNGIKSAPYQFDAGAHVSIAPAPSTAATVAALPAPPPSPQDVAPPMIAIVPFAGSADQKRAMEMLAANRSADEVYVFLAPLEDTYAGDVDFDYRLGTAAFDSGRFGESIMALQRAVSTRPQFSGARMELARAYYGQGDNESARREFTTLQAENPPEEARRVIGEYLAAIDRRAVTYQPQLGASLDLASGYDTNANGAPDTQTFLGFVLDSRNQATSSPYYSLGAGGNGSYPFAPEWRVLGNATAQYRSNPDASFVDSELAQLAGGVEWKPGALTLSALPSYGYAMLDGKANHQTFGVDTSGAYAITDTASLSLNVHYAQQRYTSELSVEDINTLLYGIASQQNVVWGVPVQLAGAITKGKDDAVQALQPFGRDIEGARASALAALGGGHSVMFAVGGLKSDYDGAFFGEARKDRQLSGTLGYEWGGWRASGWTLSAHATAVRNSSTVSLYDYRRVEAGLGVRKEFQ